MITAFLYDAKGHGTELFDFPGMVPGRLYRITSDIVQQLTLPKEKLYSFGVRLAPEFLDGPLLYVHQAIEPYDHPHVVFLNASGVALAMSSIILATAIDNKQFCAA